MADENTTIVIKKIKKGGGGHHGGAWKVAYADFVTAMMAFFLLMWLLNAASQEQKEGIADYFTPTIGLKDAKGIGFKGGEAPVEDGTSKSELMPPGLLPAQPEPGTVPDIPKPTLIDGESESNLFEKAQEELRQAIESDPNLREFTENIIMEQTPEGLKIELRDDDKHPMFQPGSIVVSQFGEKILTAMAPIIKKMPNHISITGHTDSSPFSAKRNYTNWELSSDRANSARRFLLNQDLSENRVAKIVGRASQELVLPEDTTSPRNRRIEIVLLRGSHVVLEDQYRAAPRSFLSAPKASDTIKRYQKEKAKQEQPQGDDVMQKFEEKKAPVSDIFDPVLPPVENKPSDATPKIN